MLQHPAGAAAGGRDAAESHEAEALSEDQDPVREEDGHRLAEGHQF